MSRTNLYSRSQCILGDTTTPGGVIITGAENSSWHNVPIARKTDKVFCPKCSPHIFEITEGEERSTVMGLPMAAEGHMTGCGATLIATQASSAMKQLAANQVPSMTSTNDDEFDQYIILRDEKTGELLVNCFYSLTANGQTIYGRTDEQGTTKKISASSPIDVEIEIIELHDESKENFLRDEDGNEI